MIQQATITPRDIVRNYKRIFAEVAKTKRPAIVQGQRTPPVAIVSLDDLARLERLAEYEGTKTLFDTAMKMRALLQHEQLPADLAEHHNDYAWPEQAS